MLIWNRLRLLIPASLMALAVPSYAQFSTPPKPPEVDKCNFDGSTGWPPLTSNDFQAFMNAYAVGNAWVENVTMNSPQPVSGLSGSVQGQTVRLSWTNGAKPQSIIIVERNGQAVAQLGGATQTWDHSPGPGDHTYRITPGQAVGAYLYPPVPGSVNPSVTVTVAGSPPTPSTGWTDTSLPSGRTAIHVSTSGSDTNLGTAAQPLRTHSAALARVAANSGDQILFKAGDTFSFATAWDITKGGTSTQYLVIGSYGTGARPRLQFSGSGLQIQAPNVAIVDLEIAGTNATDTSGIIALDKANVLIEGCWVRNFRDNIVIHSVGSNRIPGVKIRRNVITDAKQSTGERAQGVYVGNLDGWIIEENVFDRCGIVGSMFSRPVYVHESCSRGTYRGNIMGRSPAEGVQVRPGGTVEDNLVLRCPIGMFVGNDVAGTNSVKRNMVLESGDINTTDRRGVGIDSAGQQDTALNIVAYNTGTGWGSVQGLVIKGGGTATDNYVWDWTRDPALGGPGSTDDSQGINIEGGGGTLNLSRNVVHQVRRGMVARRLSGPTVTGTGNVYSGDPATAGSLFYGAVGTWSQGTRPADPQLRSMLPGGGIDAFMDGARLQSKANWRIEYTAADVNARARQRVGLGVNP